MLKVYCMPSFLLRILNTNSIEKYALLTVSERVSSVMDCKAFALGLCQIFVTRLIFNWKGLSRANEVIL